jgi:hypothetical protein
VETNETSDVAAVTWREVHMNAPTSLPRAVPRTIARTTSVDVPRPVVHEGGDGMAVKLCQRRAWDLLDEAVRSHISRFLSCDGLGQRPSGANCVPYAATSSLPERFTTDIRSGGAGLRRAFPGLARKVVQVSTTARGVMVEVACTGEHAGPFYGLLCPTGRGVCFSEIHDLRLESGVLVEDAVALDLRSVLYQLAQLRPTMEEPPEAG